MPCVAEFGIIDHLEEDGMSTILHYIAIDES